MNSLVRKIEGASLLTMLLLGGIPSSLPFPIAHGARYERTGATASFVLGQPDFTSKAKGTSQTQLNTPESVALDGSGGVYIADTLNHRVLHFPAPCMSNRTNGCAADLVIGQPDFTSKAKGTSQTQLNTPESVALDGSGGVYIADTLNHRVLHFPSTCLTTHVNGCAADLVIGQPDFTTHEPGTDQNLLWGPEHTTSDGQGNLYVADTENNRVLRFPSACLNNHTNGCAADLVIGQSDFTSSEARTSQTQVSAPVSLAIDAQGGLYLADMGNNRVLHFPSSCLQDPTNSCTADLVLGKPTFTAKGIGASQTMTDTPVGLAADKEGALYVVDGPNRVLHFPSTCLSKHANGCAADVVIGQPDFLANGFGTSQTQLNAPVSAALDSQGGLFVADMSNNRVVYFPPSGSSSNTGTSSAGVTINGTATLVFGQTNFTSAKAGTSQTQVSQPTGVAVDNFGGIFVADARNNRVLHFPSTCLSKHANGCAADVVIGQPNFTSFKGGTSQTQLTGPWSVAVDRSGGVLVLDSGNSRVLHFPASCLSNHTNGCAADLVIGQSNFTSNKSGTSQILLSGPLGVAIDGSEGIFVVDSQNNRVLHFPSTCLSQHTNGCTADLVIGQADFTSRKGGTSQTQFQNPHRVSLDGNGGIYVADSDNNRVLHFPTDCLSNHTNGCAADFVLGQPDFTHNINATSQVQVNIASGVAFDGAGGVYIADYDNNRILHYPDSCLSHHINGCAADFVLGQPDFSTSNGGVSQSQLFNPDSVAVGCTPGLYVTDAHNNRVLYFAPLGKAADTSACQQESSSIGLPLWVWLVGGLGVLAAVGVSGYLIIKRRRAKVPASIG